MDPDIPSGFKIISKLEGHIPSMGKSSNEELNWGYLVIDDKNKEYILMFCKPDKYTIIDKETWYVLKSEYNTISWYIGKNGYATRTINDDNKFVYLHQLIMNYVGKGKGQDSIDHINQNKLDNRISNLRITTQSEQNKNRIKVKRHSNARELPAEINEKDIPKFCVYYKECYNKEKKLFREFFTIEGHPKQDGKRQATSKSNKISIKDKLQEAKYILYELDNGKPHENIPDKNIVVNTQNIETLDIKKIEPKEKNIVQWKVSNIYNYIKSGNSEIYKNYLEENNIINNKDEFNSKFENIINSVKEKNKNNSEIDIKNFILWLRTIRHNKLCYDKNNSLVDREDRQVWRAETILRLFKLNNVEKFKEYIEKYLEITDEDKLWTKTWDTFIECVNNASEDINKKNIISKFLVSQRTKKYRKSKKPSI